MKNYISFYLVLIFFSSCLELKITAQTTQQHQEKDHLPFTQIDLQNLDAFKDVAENWKIVGDAVVDRSLPRKISGFPGTGVLLNSPNKQSRKQLFTNFEHGDIELDLDVMMPVGSNSGIYFQGRYEIQLFDSWNVKTPTYSDMGGVYQRWDNTAAKDKQGYEGHAPAINAAKAPGLWQHLKIKFTAPTFNKLGEKTKNAKFDEVWLNGVLVQKDIEVTGPTRAAAFETETSLAPLVIQGDHGPVALKNIQYKLYKRQNISISDLNFKEYNDNYQEKIPNLNMVKESKDEAVKAVSLEMLKTRNYQKAFLYTGKLNVPETGTYLFNFKADEGVIGVLVINNDTISSNVLTLKKGEAVPFSLAVSKTKPLIENFELTYEGPGIKKQSLDANVFISGKVIKPNKSMMVSAKDGAIVQRSFLRHHDEIRTHCISVGTPEGIHYSYDMNLGALLSVWSGDDFFDSTLMWTSRGGEQFGRTQAFAMPMFGYSEFASLKDTDTPWVPINEATKFIGYDFDSNGRPIFTSVVEGTTITNEFSPIVEHRGINRIIKTNGKKKLFHKINEGESIKLLEDGTYMINDDSYFIKFSDKKSLKPFIRKSNGKEELLVKIPSGKQTINYTIIW